MRQIWWETKHIIYFYSHQVVSFAKARHLKNDSCRLTSLHDDDTDLAAEVIGEAIIITPYQPYELVDVQVHLDLRLIFGHVDKHNSVGELEIHKTWVRIEVSIEVDPHLFDDVVMLSENQAIWHFECRVLLCEFFFLRKNLKQSKQTTEVSADTAISVENCIQKSFFTNLLFT